MTAELNIPKFEEFIAQYPVFEYRILDSSDISVEDRVRIVCPKDPCIRQSSIFFQCGRSIRHHEYGRNAFHQKSP